MVNKSKDRKVAAVLAFAGAVLPVAGLHKLYLGQQGWGIVYLLLSLSWMSNPIARIASVIEGVWYLLQGAEEFDRHFNGTAAPGPPSAVVTAIDLAQVETLADALRQLDQLRVEGLISEYEFEQKRRQLLDRMG